MPVTVTHISCNLFALKVDNFSTSGHFEILCLLENLAPVESMSICVFLSAIESLKGFIKEWKVCSHLCRLATAVFVLTCSIYDQLSSNAVSKTNTAPFRLDYVSSK